MGLEARKGQIVDASLVSVPIQRNSREENRQIREGSPPQEWSEAKARQKDTEARWTVKNGKSTFGYKNHIEADVSCKLIRRYAVTPASVHDSQVFRELLDPGNTSKDVWADAAYRSASHLEYLRQEGYREHIQRKGTSGHPLTGWEKQGNRTRSRTRSRVEHIFAARETAGGDPSAAQHRPGPSKGPHRPSQPDLQPPALHLLGDAGLRMGLRGKSGP